MRREIYCARGHFCHYLEALVARLSHLLLPPQVLHPRSRFCIKLLGFTKVTITQSAVFLRLCLVPKKQMCVRWHLPCRPFRPFLLQKPIQAKNKYEIIVVHNRLDLPPPPFIEVSVCFEFFCVCISFLLGSCVQVWFQWCVVVLPIFRIFKVRNWASRLCLGHSDSSLIGMMMAKWWWQIKSFVYIRDHDLHAVASLFYQAVISCYFTANNFLPSCNSICMHMAREHY